MEILVFIAKCIYAVAALGGFGILWFGISADKMDELVPPQVVELARTLLGTLVFIGWAWLTWIVW